MKVLIDARDKLRIEWGNERSSVDARNIFNNDNNVILDPILFSSLAPALQRLWLDRGIFVRQTARISAGKFIWLIGLSDSIIKNLLSHSVDDKQFIATSY
jgi:hypothetical protein